MKATLKAPGASPGTARHGPFDDRFFRTVFPDRVRSVCPARGKDVAVVVLDLANGRILDLCHVDLLTPEWMAVSVFREKGTCADMDLVLVPYPMISMITISRRRPGERNVGFQVRPLPPAGA